MIHEIVPGTNHATVTRSDETIRRAVQWLKKRIAQQKPSFVFQHDDQQRKKRKEGEKRCNEEKRKGTTQKRGKEAEKRKERDQEKKYSLLLQP